ncbi:putative metal-dependent hydrolase [Bacillus mesophilus]|uniref:M48 family metallopeptidase n=1 Tax=Bacillus mesophilus TaxID=1808955 RepID=A0A6M0Q9T6_9BACI|nr:SprT family zinc-dependent metalloprotease [Bacillus mesophilus]MBM7662160.1 putative metal-dependent hydrolase [Bacillus mesophilus]NEY72489.1 M48 family metallopeptidase [Bacillus mesophilus]
MIHKFKNQTLRFEVEYRNRGSIRITMDHYGNIEVHAPKGTSMEKILSFIEGNWELIQQNLNEMKARLSGPQGKTYQPGETFLYLGKTYPIKIDQVETIERDHVEFKEDYLQIKVKQLEDEKIKQALKRFYHQQCKALVEDSIAKHQRHFKTKPKGIRITDSKTTWGTCDSKQLLTFNWKLAMAPQKVIDYVVVHEMCHMVHLNHDRSFWRLVGKLFPDYKEQEKWLASSNWKMTV